MIMMKEEGFIREKVGTKNPFRVPDGYFEDFTSQMMEKLPHHEVRVIPIRSSRHRLLRPLLYAAACICVAVFCLAAYFTSMPSQTGLHDNDIAATHNYKSTYTYDDEVLDYAMIDNSDIYAYLSSEQ